MKAVRNVDELRRDSDAVARLANTSLQNVIDIELLADHAEFDVLSPEREGRGAAGDLQAGEVSQRIDYFFRQTVAEVFVVLVRAHVGERQHGDGRLVFGGCRDAGARRLFKRQAQVGHGLKTLPRLLLQTASNDLFENRRRLDRRWIVAQYRAQD